MGGARSTKANIGKTIVTGKKSTVSKQAGKKERREKGKDLKTYLEQFKKSSPGYVDRRKSGGKPAAKITKKDLEAQVKAEKAREQAAKDAVKKRIAREDREAAERKGKGLDFRKTRNKPSRAPSRSEIEMERTRMRERENK
tara:strand:- start:20691 stop:21113 length:423 start_codon:yes stop_codon:yes gene_type:complete